MTLRLNRRHVSDSSKTDLTTVSHPGDVHELLKGIFTTLDDDQEHLVLNVPQIAQQNGLFIVSGNPLESIDQDIEGLEALDRLIIPSQAKDISRSELPFIGVNELTLFPDLDGLSQWINWTIVPKQFWHFEEAYSQAYKKWRHAPNNGACRHTIIANIPPDLLIRHAHADPADPD